MLTLFCKSTSEKKIAFLKLCFFFITMLFLSIKTNAIITTHEVQALKNHINQALINNDPAIIQDIFSVNTTSRLVFVAYVDLLNILLTTHFSGLENLNPQNLLKIQDYIGVGLHNLLVFNDAFLNNVDNEACFEVKDRLQRLLPDTRRPSGMSNIINKTPEEILMSINPNSPILAFFEQGLYDEKKSVASEKG